MRSKIFLTIALLIGMYGCSMQRTVVEQSAVDQFNTVEGELDYWDAIAEQRVVSNNDALHGLLLVADGQITSESFDERVARAQQNGWVNESASLDPNESARVGMIAVAACDLLDIDGGVTMQLLVPIAGASPRYCTRELVYLELLPLRTENQSLSGLEFIDVINRVEDRLASQRLDPGDEFRFDETLGAVQ